MSLTKRFPGNDQEKPTYSPHIHSDFQVFTATTFLPEATLVAKLFWQAFCSYLSLCWYPVLEHCGLCCKHYVIMSFSVIKVTASISSLHFFSWGKRNPRYKTSVGNWHHGYWRTNDTILNFKMKGYWWQNSLVSPFKGQQVTSRKLEWLFKWSVNTSCA